MAWQITVISTIYTTNVVRRQLLLVTEEFLGLEEEATRFCLLCRVSKGRVRVKAKILFNYDFIKEETEIHGDNRAKKEF